MAPIPYTYMDGVKTYAAMGAVDPSTSYTRWWRGFSVSQTGVQFLAAAWNGDYSHSEYMIPLAIYGANFML